LKYLVWIQSGIECSPVPALQHKSLAYMKYPLLITRVRWIKVSSNQKVPV
jgi:hypothetical protein